MPSSHKLPARLPAGLLSSDLKYPTTYPDRAHAADFELWYVTGFGWCIPTLRIRNASRRVREGLGAGTPARTYAVRIETKGIVRIGLGPHVTFRTTVYGRKSRMKALRQYVELRDAGAGKAHMIRDRISSRRAQTEARRLAYGGW